ncbi:hypothetical protein L6R29_19545 [Myxococcota bacterium]|nr:hypothetical protein [Myxococcota bacterium]
MADWYKYLQGDRLYVHVVQVPRAKTTIHRSLLPTIHENVQESDALHIISLSDEDMQQIKVKTNEVVYVESDEENGEAIAFRGYIQQEGLSHNIQNIASSPKDLIILKLDDGNFELHTKQTINIGTRFYYMTLGEIQKTDAELIDNQNVQSWNLKTQDMLLERMRLCDRIVDQGQHLTKKERESLSFKPSKEHQITIKKPNTELCELIKNNGKTKFQHSQTSHLVHKRLLLQLASQSAGPVPK